MCDIRYACETALAEVRQHVVQEVSDHVHRWPLKCAVQLGRVGAVRVRDLGNQLEFLLVQPQGIHVGHQFLTNPCDEGLVRQTCQLQVRRHARWNGAEECFNCIKALVAIVWYLAFHHMHACIEWFGNQKPQT